MKSNCNFNDLRAIQYGHGRVGNYFTYKVRLKADDAERFYNLLPPYLKSELQIFVSAKGLVHIAIMTNQSHTNTLRDIGNVIDREYRQRLSRKLMEKSTKLVARIDKDKAKLAELNRQLAETLPVEQIELKSFADDKLPF